MERDLSQIIPLSNLVFIIGKPTPLGIKYKKKHIKKINEINFIFFLLKAESGAGKSTFIKQLISHLNLGIRSHTNYHI